MRRRSPSEHQLSPPLLAFSILCPYKNYLSACLSVRPCAVPNIVTMTYNANVSLITTTTTTHSRLRLLYDANKQQLVVWWVKVLLPRRESCFAAGEEIQCWQMRRRSVDILSSPIFFFRLPFSYLLSLYCLAFRCCFYKTCGRLL